MKCIPDAFAPERIADGLVILQKNVLFSHDKDDLQPLDKTYQLFVIQIGYELSRHIVVDILVPVAVEKVVEMRHVGGEIIAPAEPYYFVENGRIFKSYVGRMIGAQAAACRHQGRGSILLMHQRDHFPQDILFILEMTKDPMGWEDVPGIEAFFIDAVQAIYLYLPCFYLLTHGVDDLPVLIVVEMGCSGGKENNRVSGLAKDQQFHIPPEGGTKPFMIFPVHRMMVDSCCRMISFHKA